jgi:hypothetical protein
MEPTSSPRSVFQRTQLRVVQDAPKKSVNFGHVVILNGGNQAPTAPRDVSDGNEVVAEVLARHADAVSPTKRAASIYTTAGSPATKRKLKRKPTGYAFSVRKTESPPSVTSASSAEPSGGISVARSPTAGQKVSYM